MPHTTKCCICRIAAREVLVAYERHTLLVVTVAVGNIEVAEGAHEERLAERACLYSGERCRLLLLEQLLHNPVGARDDACQASVCALQRVFIACILEVGESRIAARTTPNDVARTALLPVKFATEEALLMNRRIESVDSIYSLVVIGEI